MPECAVPLTCSFTEHPPPTGLRPIDSPTKGEQHYKCHRRALPQTRPPRCEQHLNVPVVNPTS